MHTEHLRIRTKAALAISAALILCNYYYLYFVEFSQGESNAPAYVAAIKLIALSATFGLLLTTQFRKSMRVEECLLLLFILCSACLLAVKRTSISTGDMMFFNFAMCSLPFLILEPASRSRILYFISACTFILAAQTIVDFAIRRSGNSLWENDAFIGGLGNPSSYGILCALCVCYVLFLKRPSIVSLLLLGILSYGAYASSSILSVLLLGFVFFCWGVLRSARTFMIFSALCAVAFIFVYYGGVNFITEHASYKLQSVVDAATRNALDGSISVSTRAKIHFDYLSDLMREPIAVSFFGNGGYFYKGVDSQAITYLSSFGIVTSSLFFMFYILIITRCILSKRAPVTLFAFVALAVLGVSFLTNRLLDYYPVPLFLSLLILLTRRDSDGAPSEQGHAAIAPKFFHVPGVPAAVQTAPLNPLAVEKR